MIKNADAVKIIDSKREDSLIVPTMNANNVSFGLPTVTSAQDLDLPLSGAMSKASSLGLGLALAQPDRKVFVLDGDGSLLMNLERWLPWPTRHPKTCIISCSTMGFMPSPEDSRYPGQANLTGKDWPRPSDMPPCSHLRTWKTWPPESTRCWLRRARCSSTLPWSPRSRTPRSRTGPAPPGRCSRPSENCPPPWE